MIKYIYDKLLNCEDEWACGLEMYIGAHSISAVDGSFSGIWIQAYNDLEGNPNNNPGANIDLSQDGTTIKVLIGESSFHFNTNENKNNVFKTIKKELKKYFSKEG